MLGLVGLGLMGADADDGVKGAELFTDGAVADAELKPPLSTVACEPGLLNKCDPAIETMTLRPPAVLAGKSFTDCFPGVDEAALDVVADCCNCRTACPRLVLTCNVTGRPWVMLPPEAFDGDKDKGNVAAAAP